MGKMRLQKFLAEAGVCSRRKGENHIQAGLVKVNGEVVTKLGTQIDPSIDRVEFQGSEIHLVKQKLYIALNKPTGIITSCSQKNAKLVVDLIDLEERLFPIGRLDKDSSGLLLLTNDGPLHQTLSHPSFDHEKEYEVTVAQPVSDEHLRLMAHGMLLDGVKTRRARVLRLAANRFRIVLQEGRNRQIRRMVKLTGNRVQELKRIRIAGIRLGNLRPGAWRYLTPEEVTQLKAPSASSRL
jgi:23S rRNA pseudouridine2605 synthase